MDGHLLSSFIRKEGHGWRWSRKGAQAADPAERPASSFTVAPCLPLCCLHSSSKCLILIPPRQEASGHLVCMHPWAEGRVGRRDIQLSTGHLGGSSLGAHPQSLGSGREGGRRVLDSLQSLFGRVHPSCLITLPSPFLVLSQI